MNKASVKIIRKNDRAIVANVSNQAVTERRQAMPSVSEKETERSLHRIIAATVSGWITEHKAGASTDCPHQ